MARTVFSRFVWLVSAWVVSQSIAFAQVSESRPAIPTPEKHKAIHAQLDETLGLSKLKSKADKEQAVTKLMEIVEQSGESPDDLYVSLKTVIPLIRETGDFAAHQIAVQKLTETFSAEPLKETPNCKPSLIKPPDAGGTHDHRRLTLTVSSQIWNARARILTEH